MFDPDLIEMFVIIDGYAVFILTLRGDLKKANKTEQLYGNLEICEKLAQYSCKLADFFLGPVHSRFLVALQSKL